MVAKPYQQYAKLTGFLKIPHMETHHIFNIFAYIKYNSMFTKTHKNLTPYEVTAEGETEEPVSISTLLLIDSFKDKQIKLI